MTDDQHRIGGRHTAPDRIERDGLADQPNAADEPLETRPSGAPAVPDPQAGLVDDSPIDEPEAAAPTHPRLGGPIGP